MVYVVSAHKRECYVCPFICAAVHISHDEGRFMSETLNTKARGTMQRAAEGDKQGSELSIKQTSQMMYGSYETMLPVLL